MNVNERIAKLYDQAIIIEDGGDYVCGELDPEKFAQLIVAECCDIVHRKTDESIRVVMAIEQHFGVE